MGFHVGRLVSNRNSCPLVVGEMLTVAHIYIYALSFGAFFGDIAVGPGTLGHI